MMTGHLAYNINMITIGASEFKAKCLQLLDRVNLGETIRVTKRGKVVAEVHPPTDEEPTYSGPGAAKGIITIVGDIMAPLDEDWEALR
jgi:antitoxin (DNA-binding transcriptional repressor) of toxin-antitoxin stability system